MDLGSLLIVLGGLSDYATLRANASRRAIRRAVREGAIVHVARDRYALPSVDEALGLARRVNGYLVHESAALHWGWEVRMPPEEPKVAVPRGVRRSAAGVRRMDLRREDLDGWATNRLQTALMCAADLPLPDALAVTDSALRHGDVSRDHLERGASALHGERGRRARRVVAYADGLAANPFESALRALAVEAGVEVVPQLPMRLGGHTVRPDLTNPILGMVLEADSWEFHGRAQRDFNRDVERYTAMTAAGWRVLRFTWKQVMFDPDHVVALIRQTAALARSCVC
ncbi:MAG: DUF559 domain-containing protein [Nocardioides sp.]|uniref:DUF559 domain-containing protein n=1 Tax=Nocardioides sp. TaxID=35761 RepID=UPI0039E22056